ncbi:hypothetical protein KP748_01465, partial [Streptococcus equi subsp. zooepidemicus]|nr:hypothetical protein [Streptococcus equi subsp. zooepidemicus]
RERYYTRDQIGVHCDKKKAAISNGNSDTGLDWLWPVCYLETSSRISSQQTRELVVLTPNSQNILTGTIPAFEEKTVLKSV